MKLINEDCIKAMETMPENFVDSIITDPPYELGFMGKSWDSSGIAFNVGVWKEALRVLKPGGHLIAFSGSRTYHRMAVAIEDAGFQIRDQIMWIYGSGFPKSHNLQGDWEGWGTALKPAHEPIVLARKPLIGTVLNNVTQYKTGALNIESSRIGTGTGEIKQVTRQNIKNGNYNNRQNPEKITYNVIDQGRWPANLIHDGNDEVLRYFAGSASFFYCAKASEIDRDEGLENFIKKEIGDKGNGLGRKCSICNASTLEGCECPNRTFVNPIKPNYHPTVKPTDLMRYLCKMVTPPKGIILDPFMGSGSTGKAAILDGFDFIGIEQSEEYVKISEERIKWAKEQYEGYLL